MTPNLSEDYVLSIIRKSDLEFHILSVIKKSDPSKSHDHDNMSIRKLKLCDKTSWKPLHMIYKSCLENGVFPSLWKMVSLVPIHKKNKQLGKELQTRFTTTNSSQNI